MYRISLAISDFFTGIIVFLSFIISSFRPLNTTKDNQSAYDPYIYAIGLFSMLSLHVSIFKLIAAVIDRFKVVYRPLSYNVQSSISLWIISIILAALPLGIFGSFRYTIEYSILSIPDVSQFSNDSLFMYLYLSCIFLISVLVMWIFTIIRFVFFQKISQQKKKNNLNACTKARNEKTNSPFVYIRYHGLYV